MKHISKYDKYTSIFYNPKYYKTLIIYDINFTELKLLNNILKDKNMIYEMVPSININYDYIDIINIKSNTLIKLLYSENKYKIQLALNLLHI